MTSSDSILFSEKNKVVKYNSKDNNYEWVIDLNNEVS